MRCETGAHLLQAGRVQLSLVDDLDRDLKKQKHFN